MSVPKSSSSGGAGAPDWGKFGLDSERQPLNPGKSGTGTSKPSDEPPDLFGGQAQHDNELFADDQASIRDTVPMTAISWSWNCGTGQISDQLVSCVYCFVFLLSFSLQELKTRKFFA